MADKTVGRKGPWADDAEFTNANVDNFGNQLFAKGSPDYLEYSRRGYLFTGRSAVAAIAINSTCTNNPTLFNPSDSNRIVVPLRIMFTCEALGTPVIHGLQLCRSENAGNMPGSGLVIASGTAITPKSLRFGDTVSALAKFYAAAVAYTTTDQSTNVFMDLGMGIWKSGTSAAGEPYNCLDFDLKGMVTMKPGTVLSVCANVASSTTYCTTIVWAELPNITY
jgi:hypothetical protein